MAVGARGGALSRPTLPLLYLDTLWLQIAGTLCNIACRHCFVSAGPKVELHRMMTLDQVRSALAQGEAAGMRSVWLTGGEPFLHPQILEVIDLCLARGPLGILTNGMLIDDRLALELGQRFRAAEYSLEIRVSLDGADRESNDRVRGAGVFDAACAGLRRLSERGLEPIVAVSTLDDGAGGDQAAFVELLRSLGVRRPRVKWIPPFRIGREAGRRGGRPYEPWEILGPDDLANPEAPHRVQCGTSRCVTAEGAWACPILVNVEAFRMGDSLADALRPHPVDHPACHTCWSEAFSCST